MSKEKLERLGPKKVQAAIDAAGSLRQAHAVLGVAYGTMALYAKKHGLVSPAAKRAAAHKRETLKWERHRQKQQKKRIRALEREVEKLRNAELDRRAVRSTIMGLCEHSPTPPKWLTCAKTTGTNEAVPFTHWSDWHYGEVVKKDQIAGINEFNMNVADKRIAMLANKVIELCHTHLPKMRYPGLVVGLNGDFLSGDIHDELSESNDAPTIPAMLRLFDAMVGAFEHLLAHFPKVFVPCQDGNHGRKDKDKRNKNRKALSFDWLLYCLLERHYKQRAAMGCKAARRIQFYIPDDIDTYFRIYNTRLLMTHGDQLGVGGGNALIGPLGPMQRGNMKTSKVNSQIGRPYDFLVIGHYHTRIELDGLLANGSLVGYSEYPRNNRMLPQPPEQGLYFFNAKYGWFASWPVKLGPLTETPAAPWASVMEGEL